MSTPTKAAEIRDELASIRKRLHGPHFAMRMEVEQHIDRALALLADMEREGGPVRYGTAPGLHRNCSGCDFLSTPSESKYFHYCPGCGSGIHPSPTTADAMDSQQLRGIVLEGTPISEREVIAMLKNGARPMIVPPASERRTPTTTMTPDTTIEEQARREAEAAWIEPSITVGTTAIHEDGWIMGYAAALVAGRSKPSVEEVMEVVEQWQDEVVDGLNNPEGNEVGLDQLRDRLTKLFNK